MNGDTQAKKKGMKNPKTGVALLLLFAFFALSLSGCTANISSYEDREILVTGLEQEDFTVTVGDLAAMECVSEKTTGNTKKAKGTVRAYGPTLETFTENYGHSLDEFYYVKFHASDDYDVTLSAVTWDEYEPILSIANGSRPLDEYQQPFRLVIPGADSGKWVRMVEKMEFKSLEDR